MALTHDKIFDPEYGRAVEIAPGVRRMTVNNPGPFTFHGTNTYLVGEKEIAVIDPGPDDPSHIEAIVKAAGKDRIAAILISHTHRDHSPGTPRLQALTGAPTYAEGPHRSARPLNIGEINPLDGSGDREFMPDHRLGDGDAVELSECILRAIETPGHTANHLSFSLDGSGNDTGIAFSADHVMAWSTSIVAPPDGAMVDYMASLDRMIARSDDILFPGHGGPVRDPATYLRDLKGHRLGREKAVLDRISAGLHHVPDMVQDIYRDVDPRLHPAAALSVLAHLEDLAARGIVACDGPVDLKRAFTLADRQ